MQSIGKNSLMYLEATLQNGTFPYVTLILMSAYFRNTNTPRVSPYSKHIYSFLPHANPKNRVESYCVGYSTKSGTLPKGRTHAMQELSSSPKFGNVGTTHRASPSKNTEAIISDNASHRVKFLENFPIAFAGHLMLPRGSLHLHTK